MSCSWPSLISLLVHIQSHLDEDLSLASLSSMASLSPGQFHRSFKAMIGETPKEYVARLRLERAAFRLLVHDATLLELALDCGFKSHETFTRAFCRRFGMAPNAYRTRERGKTQESVNELGDLSASAFSVSETKIRRLLPCHLAFIRHVGPYEAVPDTLFDTLDVWAKQQGHLGPRIWMGLGHDAPGTTAPAHLRFDAALVVPSAFTPSGAIGHQRFEGGDFAVTTHVGPFAMLSAAYATVFPRVVALPRHQLIGLPAVEIYHSAQVNAQFQLNVTDICLPVRSR